MSEAAAQKTAFLAGLVVSFKEQMHTDVLVHPGDQSPPIPSHKAILVTSLFFPFSTLYMINTSLLTFIMIIVRSRQDLRSSGTC